ncbi:hypothetical protein HPULCUR_011977 [Helicostylum pulchrum]|uniref:Uncharacterized protein n=1 Tax=Helicostylum pulchrum TaxID=562976 RepID=A0ABP9YHL5_9FUNG
MCKTRDKKKQQVEQVEQVEIEPITIKSNKKRSKRRKVLKKAHQKAAVKKRERSVSISSSIEETVNTPPDLGNDETEWTTKKKIVNKHCFPSCITTTTTPFENTKVDLHLPSPEITPIQSEDEQQLLPSSPLLSERHNWYSPFITGLDLDIIPKLPLDPFLLFTTNHFKSTTTTTTTTIPDIHQQQQSRIKLLEIHPFIPSPPSSSIHTHHAYGTIGDKRKINICDHK